MEKKKYGVFKRLTALALSLVMVLSMLPAVHTAAAVVENSQQADPSTMDTWKDYFHPTNVTTAHAGGVWTDKSVLTQSPFGNAAITIDGENNFLVALSALGSNSVVIGENYAPTDTMFVLDVSNSMSDNALSNMVTATNNAIRTLLAGEENTNRVGVVLFGTNANVLLPLDHYEGVEINGVETFIEMSGSDIRTARTGQSDDDGNWWDDIFGGGSDQTETTYLKDSNGNDVTTTVSAGGGTYVQGGLWKAWQEFDGAADDFADTDTQRRAPVLVLMCDGAATYSATDFDNIPDSSSHGSGSNSRTGDGFVTQLTAAYIKEKMKREYGSAFFYTLGLDVDDIAIAQAILDPANKTAATDIDDAWANFLSGSVTLSMYRRGRNSGEQNVTISNDSDVTFTANSYQYADKYFSATQISDLNQQFQNIVNEISLSAGYYPTHLDDNGSNFSGYITFVDELGKGMEVKQIEGILLGDNIYTGEIFARALASNVFGSKEAPTEMGNEFVRAVKARLGLPDNNEAWALLEHAWEKGYLSYTPATATEKAKWSNYIVWYGDANGDYLGYEEALASTASYRNVCYAMIGAPDGIHQSSDMMYVGIQISTNLNTGDQTVTFRVPASVLPVVTYQINIHGSIVADGETATLNYHAAEPIRLLYEVGVKDEINEKNVRQYATQIGNRWYLYTNKWNQNPDLSSTADNNLSYAYFEPGEDNEHYYFTEDVVVYDADGNAVANKEALDPGKTYYYEHYIFNQPAANADGSFTVKADFHKEPLSESALSEAQVIDGKLCVPKGTLHYDDNHHSAEKGADNKTETFGYVRYQIVDATEFSNTSAENYELVYLGNNGRLEVQPATGISITKRVDHTITDADASYEFEIEFTGVADGVYNGIPVSNGKATLKLKANETAYIFDLPAGATYKVVEKYGDGYKESASVNRQGTVAEDSIIEVTFTNTKRGTGSLSIEKGVTDHPFTTGQIESLDFNFVVELAKEDGAAYSGDVSAIKSGDSAVTKLTFANGKASFTLHDNQELNLLDLPEGTTYKVYEVDAEGNAVAIGGVARAGFKLVSVAGGTASNIAQGEIAEGEVEYAHFVNKYEATPIQPQITQRIEKTVVGNAGMQTYTFMTERMDNTEEWQNQISIAGDSNDSHNEVLNPVFDQVGTYRFLVYEVTPDNKIPGMTYDAKRASFTVVVTDNNMDGALEWAIGDVVNATKSDTAPHVIVSFTNIYDEGSATATFHAKKNLINNSGIDILLSSFRFGLYKDAACTEFAFVEDPAAAGYDASNPRTVFTAGPAGMVDIKVHITRTMLNGAPQLVYYLKEVVPAEPVPGMIYDTTVYKVTIPVNDDGADLTVGQIEVEPVAGNSDVESAAPTTAIFNNEYKVKSTTVELSGNKTVNGRDWKDGETFTFELYGTDATFHFHAEDKLAEAVAQAGTKTFAFEKLTFDKVGIYHYVVAEKNSGLTIDGLTYDHVEYHITVTVTLKEGTDELQAAVTAVKLGNGAVSHTALNFVNVYKAAPAKATLSGIKQVQNNSDSSVVISPKGYSFELRRNNSAGEVLQTVTSDAEGKFSFDELTFTEAGEYVFEVIEVGAGNTVINGVSYNAGNWNVKVVVTDDGMGRLVAEVKPGDKGLTNVDPADKSKGSSVFINQYTAEQTKLGLTGYKELVGMEGTNRPLQAEDFSFTLKPVGNAPMPNGVASLTTKNGADGKIIFPEIPFNQVGQYQYTIEEEKEADGTDGIYYDKVIYTVTITVVDKGVGKLEAKVSHIGAKTGDDESVRHVIDFFNGYAASSVNVVVSGNKVLENVTPGIADADKIISLTGENLTKFPFRFVMEAVTENAPLPAETAVSSGENGAIIFGTMTFDKVGTYQYTVKEVIPEGSNGVVDGVTYTQQTHNITIVVTDDQHGKLKAEVKLDDATKAEGADNVTAEILSFKNTYKAEPPQDPEDPTGQPGSVVFEGIKKVENLSDASVVISPAGYQFQLVAGDQVLQTVVSDADGKFIFDEQVFDTLGEFTFTIREVPGDKEYITYYGQSITVKVQVTDEDLDGWMEIAVTYDNEASLTVTNQYKAGETKLALTGNKKVDTRAPRENEFSFKLTALGGAPMPGTESSITVKNNAAGEILFPEITYDSVGVYNYTMEEVREADGTLGVTYDKTVYEITVTVSDVGNGTLVAVAKSIKQGQTEEADVVFFNKYQAAPAEVDFEGIKTLEGRDLADGEFTFLLTDEAGKVLQTVKNKDGKVSFETEKLLAAGTYKFFIKEDASAKIKGITYDAKVHEVVIEVKDDGFGQLKAYIGQTEAKTVSFTFTNTFTPEDIQAEVTVNKQLQNLCDKPMGLEGFQFQLEDAEGKKTVQASDAEGIAKFQLTFGAEDAGKVFTYKLTEVDTQIKGMSYSAAEFEVKVAVTKDESTGKLSAAVTLTKGGEAQEKAVFVNIYNLEEPPKMGDETNLMGLGLCMGISGVSLLAVLVLGKKKFFAE